MLRRLLSSLIILATSLGFALAQGSITGTVTDSITGEAIIGANVIIQGTQTGSSTDIEGKFLIAKVSAGIYNLQISSVTYKTHLIPDVVVENGKKTTIDVSLSEDVSELNEVVVTGTRQIDNDFSLMSSIRESKLVVSGISAEMITKSPDRDAAEVIKRVPGVSIMGGRFVIIRGLSERYNVTMLHGAYAPSMEADKRSFAFDIIPSGQIDQMLVFKSPSPELPGDFAGGVVKISTKGIPDENSITIGYSTGYRAGTTFEDFSRGERGDLQALGFNSGLNDLPSGFPKDIRKVSGDNQLNKAGRSLRNNWTPEKVQAFMDQSASVTGSFKFNIGKIQVGNVTALNWSSNKIHYTVGRKDFNEYDFAGDKTNPTYDYQDDQNNQNVRLGALFNWAFQFDENNKIEFKNLYNQINNSQYIERRGTNIQDGYTAMFGAFQETLRGVYSSQLLGKHKLFNARTNVNWVLNYSSSYRDLPDMRRYRRDIDTQTGAEKNFLPVGAAQTFFLGRFFLNMNESAYSGSVSIDHTLKINDNFLPVVSAGMFYENKERSFNARNLGYVVPIGYDESLRDLSIGELFEKKNINSEDGLRLDEQTNSTDSYDAKNHLRAYYLGLSLPFTKQINVSGGLRMEDNTLTLISGSPTSEPKNPQVKRLLPSANVSYNFNEKMLVRATYGQTLNRPEFREIAEFGFYDFEYNWVISGNPNLSTAKIQNYDVRWEWYPSKTEMITVGAFFKDFKDAIEMNVTPGSGSIRTFNFVNAQSARNFGMEIDVRKSLFELTSSKFIDKLSLLFNAAFIKSAVKVGNLPERPLMGQSPYVINGGLYYNDDELGLQVSAMYNVAGRRLFAVGAYSDDASPRLLDEDIYEMPRNILDLSITKTIGERLQVKLSISDILNQKYVLMQDGNGDNKFDEQKDQVLQSNQYGTLFTAGFTYKVW
jgi:outer membrane receptor protein involved in Fe transport